VVGFSLFVLDASCLLNRNVAYCFRRACSDEPADDRRLPGCDATVMLFEQRRVIGSPKCDTPDECCAANAEKEHCVAWTHWLSTNCHLFSSVSGENTGDPTCMSGNFTAGPPPPPKPLPYPDRTPPGPPCTDCPNIVFSLTDDQDVTRWDPMRQTHSRIQAQGATLSRWTIHTPICSPSRSETVSGRYFHNIKSNVAVPPPKVLPAATAHVNGTLYVNQSFGYLLRTQRGYQVGMFGKSNFNTYQGFDRWFQGASLGYGNNWEDDESPGGTYHANKSEYATSLLSNKTSEWLARPTVGRAARPCGSRTSRRTARTHRRRPRTGTRTSARPSPRRGSPTGTSRRPLSTR
jgi:hypothetical protein